MEYKPKHMAPRSFGGGLGMRKMRNRIVVGALTATMVAPSVLTPAANALAYDYVTIETNFSGATQRLIKSDGEKMSVDEILAAIKEAEKVLDAAIAAAQAAEATDNQNGAVLAAAQGAFNTAESNYNAMDAATASELASQIDKLNAELASARQKVADLKKQSEDAQSALDQLNGDKTTAEADLADKQAALDEANQALKNAEDALAALGENPTADEQAAYDAAKKAYDEALADKEAKQAAADEAKAALDKLNADIVAKRAALSDAQATVEAKRTAKAEADAALANAQAAYAATVEQIKADLIKDEKDALDAAIAAQQKQQDAYDAIKDAGSEEDVAAALDALNAAKAVTAEKQTAYNNAVATAGGQAKAEADAAIAEKQAAADKAAQDLKNCEGIIATYPGEIGALEGQIAVEQQRIDDAKTALDAANALVTEKQQAVDAAQTALDNLAEEQAAWDEAAASIRERIETAKQAVATAQGEFDQAQAAVKTLDEQITAKQAEIDAIKKQIAESSEDVADHADDVFAYIAAKFKTSNNFASADAQYAFNELMEELGSGKDQTHLDGDAADASTIDNMLKALDLIDQINEIRKLEGLPELQVSSYYMALSIVNVNWSAVHGGHKPNGMAGENVAMPSDNAGDGWYWQEKAYAAYTQLHDGKNYGLVEGVDFFINGDRDNPYNYYTVERRADGTEIKHFVTPGTCQTGHYENVVNGSYRFIGGAVTDDNGSWACQNYHNGIWVDDADGNYVDNITFDQWQGFTTNEFRSLIEECIAASMDPDPSLLEQLNKLMGELNALEDQKATADATVATKQQALKDAQAEQTAAEQALADLGERPDIESAQAALNAAKSALKSAKQAASDAQSAYDETKADAEANIADAEARKSEVEQQLATAQGQLDALKQASEQAIADLENTHNQYAGIVNASDALDTAKANAESATNALNEANEAVDALNNEINNLEHAIASAERDYQAKLAAAEAAGPTAEQAQALNDAKAALDVAKQQVADLTAKRDAAQKTADAAQDAVDATNQLIADINAAIDEQAKLRDDANAQLPDAELMQIAWEDAFAQADAEMMVKDGAELVATRAAVETPNSVVYNTINTAHVAYTAKLEALDIAQKAYDDAKAALEAAQQDKTASEADLALKREAVANAQAELDALKGQLPEEKPAQPVDVADKAEDVDEEAMPRTGDAALVAATVTALVGVAAVAGGAHFRRRNE